MKGKKATHPNIYGQYTLYWMEEKGGREAEGGRETDREKDRGGEERRGEKFKMIRKETWIWEDWVNGVNMSKM